MKAKILIACGIVSILTLGVALAESVILNVTLSARKNSSVVTKSPGALSMTWAGQRFFDSVISITNTWVPLSKGSVDTNGVCYLQNLSTNLTCYVSFDCGATTNLTLKATEYQVIRLTPTYDPTNISVKGDSAVARDFEFLILED